MKKKISIKGELKVGETVEGSTGDCGVTLTPKDERNINRVRRV